MQQKAIADRDLGIARLEADTKAQQSKANAEAALNKTAAQFTEDSIKSQVKYLTGLSTNADRVYRTIASKPTEYDAPATFANIEKATGELQQIIGMALANSSTVKPGQAWDASPFINAASAIKFEPVLNANAVKKQGLTNDEIESRIDKNTAQTGLIGIQTDQAADPEGTAYSKESGKTKARLDLNVLSPGGKSTVKVPESSRKLLYDWQGKLSAMDAANNTYLQKQKALPDIAKYNAGKGGADDPLRGDMSRATDAVNETNAVARQIGFATANGDLGPEKKEASMQLISRGLTPFDVNSRPKIHSFFSEQKKKAALSGNKAVADQAEELSMFFTGLPADGRAWGK